ncbi:MULTISPECIES: methylmalonyl Co-A mutase-associated GTPase MeaB [unclassified Minwuia]|jgi:GTPase|uniref:methylmalonyl Co-A mutase-associated GTPase MeaB n=1 Tax=unclassified Minwuia TaxID=2618799 RepID=UPI0024793E7A|nr:MULTISPECIES: methylmalonyl Co-A mutase-associated GTPase MeaB [unclassified Minwuia]
MTDKLQDMADRILAGQRRALARGITLVESSRADHREQAKILLEKIVTSSGNAVRVGISGTPGVGKSTFIEAFGQHLTAQDLKVAVLAVDPSSKRTGGSILGDKTRMEHLARDPNAFIRPSPSGGTLGGVARRTRETMLLAEAAGFDVILVETVGVGQSETTVAEMVDIFCLLLAPGGGDELQGIKRGVMELADLVIINKADGDLLPAARRAATEYRGALGLMRPKTPHWSPRVRMASAVEGNGIPEVWRDITKFRDDMTAAGALETLRAEQARSWMWQELTDSLVQALMADAGVARALPEWERQVMDGTTTPGAAADALRQMFLDGSRSD